VNPQTNNKDYRADIDGLRAIAIISVVLYHINPNILPGGFVGVDVFFVISGFLITTHILYEINIKKKFSFSRFYIKRIKRILPALLFMNLIVLIIGYFILTNFYFHALGEQVYSANLSYSNIYFYFTSGYFDLDSSIKPLLHTWSLGVEEQFYLIWPLLLVSVYFITKNPKYYLLMFILFFVLSYGFNGVYSDDLNAIFFLMPFRIFEFSAGAIISYLLLTRKRETFEGKKTTKNVIALLSLILIVTPMFYLNEKSIFPYYNALPTILGSIGLIYFKNSVVSSILSLRWIVFVGLISYSLYLYHWPVMFFFKFQLSEVDDFYLNLLIISVSVILSLLSYYLVEKPFIFSQNSLIPVLFSLLVVSVFLSSSFVKMMKINSFNYAGEIIDKSVKESLEEQSFFLQNNGCRIDNNKKSDNCDWTAENQILFLGNSHNLNSHNMFYALLNHNKKYNLIYPGDVYTCIRENLYDVSEGNICRYGVDKLTLDKFVINLDVLVVNFFNIRVYGAMYMSLINDIRKLNPEINIIVVGGFIGTRPHNCRELINKYEDLDMCRNKKFVSFWGEDEIQWVLSQDFAKDKFLYVDSVELLCGKEKELNNCVTRTGKDLIFYDGDHFSLHGSNYLSNLMGAQYRVQLNALGIYY